MAETAAEEKRVDPEREARRRLALAQVRQYPDPVLRMKALHPVVPNRDALCRIEPEQPVVLP